MSTNHATSSLARQRAWCTLLVVGCVAAPAQPAVAAGARATLGDDVFVAGGAPTVREPVAGDLLATGGSVEVDAPVAGDAAVAGGRIVIKAPIAGSLQAAGGQLVVQGPVGESVRAAGGQIEFAPSSDVAGSLSVAGGQVRLLGAVRGDVRAAGGRVSIDGTVGGDVIAGAGDLELGPNARIAGVLRHRGGNLRRDPAAQVLGGLQSWPGWWGEPERTPAPDGPTRASGWVWTVALVALAAVLLGVGPQFHARVARTLQQRPGRSVLLGLAWLVCAPLLLVLLLLTVIGIPLTLLGGLLYVVLLPVAYVSTAIAVGDAALQAWRAPALGSWAWRTGAAALVLVVLAQAWHLPWLGVALMVLALLAGLGALALQLRRSPQPG